MSIYINNNALTFLCTVTVVMGVNKTILTIKPGGIGSQKMALRKLNYEDKIYMPRKLTHSLKAGVNLPINVMVHSIFKP